MNNDLANQLEKLRRRIVMKSKKVKEKSFESLKEEILRRAKEASACKPEYGRAYQSENYEQLMEVLRDNFHWACRNGVLDAGIIEQYKEEFAEGKIYLNVSVTEGFLLAWDNATVEASGNATVEAWDNAYITSSYTIECKLSDKAIYRIRETNTIRYNSDVIQFEKV